MKLYQGVTNSGKTIHAMPDKDLTWHSAICGQHAWAAPMEWDPESYTSCKHCVNVYRRWKREENRDVEVLS